MASKKLSLLFDGKGDNDGTVSLVFINLDCNNFDFVCFLVPVNIESDFFYYDF